MTTTPNFPFQYLVSGALNQEQRVNDAMNLFDAFLVIIIQDDTVTDPSTLTPSNGELWVVAAGAIGAWAGQDGMIAAYYDGWIFITPKDGWKAEFLNTATEMKYDSGWQLYDVMKRLLEFSNPASGPYTLLASDSGKLVTIDDALTIPTGLVTGFQCTIHNDSGSPVALVTTGLTLKGGPNVNISAQGVIVIAHKGADVVLIKGDTEA